MAEDTGGRTGRVLSSVYVLNSTDDVEAFKQEANPLLPDYYHVVASTDQYDQIAGGMNRLGNDFPLYRDCCCYCYGLYHFISRSIVFARPQAGIRDLSIFRRRPWESDWANRY